MKYLILLLTYLSLQADDLESFAVKRDNIRLTWDCDPFDVDATFRVYSAINPDLPKEKWILISTVGWWARSVVLSLPAGKRYYLGMTVSTTIAGESQLTKVIVD